MNIIKVISKKFLAVKSVKDGAWLMFIRSTSLHAVFIFNRNDVITIFRHSFP